MPQSRIRAPALVRWTVMRNVLASVIICSATRRARSLRREGFIAFSLSLNRDARAERSYALRSRVAAKRTLSLEQPAVEVSGDGAQFSEACRFGIGSNEKGQNRP